MRIRLSVHTDGSEQHLDLDLDPASCARDVAILAASQLGIEAADIEGALEVGDEEVEPSRPLSAFGPQPHFRLRRVCVRVHFEAEPPRERHFPARARWERVHDWACRQFRVAPDLCANLELRDGSVDGPPINEKNHLGFFIGCRVVWLVKPGPEPNGR